MRILRLILITLIPLIVYSMSEPAQIPPELKKLRAKVVDKKGVVHELVAFRCNEGSVLKFKKGSLDYTLSLSSVKTIEVVGQEDGYTEVVVKLKDCKKDTFLIPSSTRCSAQSDVGDVSFYMNEVKRIELYRGEDR
jgi:hypothetical protein